MSISRQHTWISNGFYVVKTLGEFDQNECPFDALRCSYYFVGREYTHINNKKIETLKPQEVTNKCSKWAMMFRRYVHPSIRDLR